MVSYSTPNLSGINILYRVQDKGSRFVVLDNEDYMQMNNYQLGSSSFEELDYDPSTSFSERVNL